MENNDLKFIKKHYGEKFAHFCRDNFPTFLEAEGLLSKAISDNFAYTHSLYNDIVSSDEIKIRFVKYINSIVRQYKRMEKIKLANVPKTAEELMDEAGYILYPECKTEKEIQSFKDYYVPGEELCTFWGDRLETCRVWFAVKKDVEKIKRKDFPNPERQDAYGTSVISIQFARFGFNTISIKNRYNHSVNNPDSTFGNNLENIIPGLTLAFEKEFGIVVAKDIDNVALDFCLPQYCRDKNLRFHRYNCYGKGCHYCENNIIIKENNQVIQLDKSQYLLMDNYIVDFKNKDILMFKNGLIFKNKKDSFINSLGDIKDIKLTKDECGNKVVVITPRFGENILVTLDVHNAITGLVNNNVKNIKARFLPLNKSLKTLTMNNIEVCGDYFLFVNKCLQNFEAPKLTRAGNFFLYYNNSITELALDNLKRVGNYFLYSNEKLETFSAKKLCYIGNMFLRSSKKTITDYRNEINNLNVYLD